jgi:hypothetical protein
MKSALKIILVVILIIFVAPFVLMFGMAAFSLATRDNVNSAVGDPGKATFEEINRSITSYKGENSLGNNPEAIALANIFSLSLKNIREEAFTKGKEGGFSLSDGHFITYCYLDSKSLMFFCHVPELRRYSDDAKEALTKIAWTIAQKSAQEKQVQDKELVVGLRGVALYYQFWFGTVSGQPKQIKSSTDGKNRIYQLLTDEPSEQQQKSTPAIVQPPNTSAPDSSPAPIVEPTTSAPTAQELKEEGNK